MSVCSIVVLRFVYCEEKVTIRSSGDGGGGSGGGGGVCVCACICAHTGTKVSVVGASSWRCLENHVPLPPAHKVLAELGWVISFSGGVIDK